MVFELIQKPVGTLDLLLSLHYSGRTNVTAIISTLRMSKDTFYRALRRLESLGYVGDEREIGYPPYRYVKLTQEGEALACTLVPVANKLASTARSLRAG